MLRRALQITCALVLACSSPERPTSEAQAAPAPAAAPSPSPAPSLAAAPAASPAPAAPVAPAAPLLGVDFTPQARVLYRVAACGGTAPVPDGFDAAMIDKHCAALGKSIDAWKRDWLDVAKPFLARVVPSGVPDRVVYPFGGGDLLVALATFPDAAEITTISLEGMGDPRAIDVVRGRALERQLEFLQRMVGEMLHDKWNATTSLNEVANADLPGQLVFALVALAIHGHEPVAVRYFRLEPDGSIHYLTAEDLAAADAPAKKGRKRKQVNEAQRSTFNDVEIQFRPVGDPAGRVRVYRHIVADLSDPALRRHPALLGHLEAKGKVSAMTKAASHLLWYNSFSRIRNYLLQNMEWMISDATGIPPVFARPAGFTQETWGRFVGSFFHKKVGKQEQSLIDLWEKNPHRELPFRYGYFDKKGANHMMVTRRGP